MVTPGLTGKKTSKTLRAKREEATRVAAALRPAPYCMLTEERCEVAEDAWIVGHRKGRTMVLVSLLEGWGRKKLNKFP